MAFQFDSDSQQQIPDMAPPPERIGKFTVLIFAAFGLLVIALFAWHPLTTAARAVLARRNAKEAHEAIAQQDWVRAHHAVTLARQRTPTDVDVIMAMVAFLKATRSDPSGLAQQLRLLAEQRPLTEEEELLLGRALIASGKIVEARGVYEKLPLQQSTRRPGLELLSSILTAEGHTKEAQEIDQRAAAQTVDDTPETQLKAAVTDVRSHFGAVKNQALNQLWQLAELSTETALKAIHELAITPGLTVPEGNRLLALVAQHPLKTLTLRLEVVSLIMRLQPAQRNELAQAEIARFSSSKNGRREEIAYWLMRENFNDEVFELVPRDLAMQSRELYPILVQTLAQAQRWEELQGILKMQRPPVSKSLLDLAMAEVQSHLQPDMRESRRLLQGTITNSIQAGNVSTLRAAAQLAEKLHFADIACQAYQAAGVEAAANNSSVEALDNLQKSVELAMLAKDTRTLLEASRRLHELSPSSAVYADRFAYLQLILGVEMESVNLATLEHPNDVRAALAVHLERIPPQLLQALSAYRFGDRAAMQQHLAALQGTESLSAGPRAVVAGLLSLVGKADRAYQMAEKIPGALLLDEELMFLKRAL